MINNQNFRSGFVAIVGRPNVGKSTFLNRAVGQKVSIMSSKAQTTRNKIQGVYTSADCQMVFLDTPGIQKSKDKLGTFMEESAMSALKDVDAVIMMVSAPDKKGPGDQFIIDRLKKVSQPVYLVINKIDEVSPNDLPGIVADYKKALDWADIIPISALLGSNVDELLKTLTKHLPKGPQYYPDDQVTDHPERFIIAELIREKVFELTRQEIPYATAIDVQKIKKQDNGQVHIQADIVVERPGQKGIIIGKGGSMLKKIGTLARQDIQDLLGSKVYLELWVHVHSDWRDNNSLLKEYGYRKTDY